MTRQEGFVTFTLSFKDFQFGSHVDSTVTVVAYIERYNANRIAGNEELIALLVIEHKGEDATQVFEEIDAFLTIECQNHFTVGTCLELILPSIATPNLLMIVDFSIDGEHLLTIRREQGLSARFWVDDAQSLMGEDGCATTVDTTPVRSAMTDLLTHFQCFFTQLMRLLLDIQYCNNSTHILIY